MSDSPVPNSGSANKRTAPRWALRLRCRFLAAGDTYEGIITDISHGGAFVESQDCPLVGADVTLQVAIGEREFELPGLVRHSGWFLQELHNCHGFGVEFGKLSQSARSLVEQILSRLHAPAPIKTALEP